MSNSQAVCTSFKKEVMLGEHQLGTATLVSRTSLTAPTTDTLNAALYLASGSLGAGTTAYSATSEVSGSGYSGAALQSRMQRRLRPQELRPTGLPRPPWSIRR